MQVVRVEGISQTENCIQFLKHHSCCNLYLYEGIKRQASHHYNYIFKEKGSPVGVLHTKSGRSVHLFLSEGNPDAYLKRVLKFIIRRFSGLNSIFGDSVCLLELIKAGYLGYSGVREYLFLEIKKEHFNFIGPFVGRVPPVEEAGALYPLQYQYEIEEMGASESVLDKERITAVLQRRILRDEITSIFEQDKPVAIAGLNARFEDICQVGSVYVVPEYRGKGYGYSVVSSHIRRLFDKYNRIVLFVDVRNKRAIHIYNTIGFITAGELVQISLW
ncbi:MAG: GNAT family N-acetyltransferase [Spirochaetota bacterium]|nr:MAG: GNAT family N-acetyltransferase [Spirochaetota bacterium]